jgi:hypothetical protein
LGLVRPDELVQRRSVLPESERTAGVRDRGLDLAAMADDSRVAEQALHVALAEAGDALGVEVRERRSEVVALAQDRQPGQAGLEALEAEPFEQPALVAHGTSPFVVVVLDVELVGHGPAAFRLSQRRP